MLGIGELALAGLLLGPAADDAKGVATRDCETCSRTAWVADASVEGDAPAGAKQAFETALRDGLDRAGFAVAAGEDACDADTSCRVAAARRAAADYAVTLSVSVARRDYTVEVTVLDATSGAVVSESREVCEVCGLAEAVTVVDSLAGAVVSRLDALALEPPRLRFSSAPQAALIRLDGEVVGETPFERPVAVGSHTVSAEKAGYVSESRDIEAIAGVSSSVRFELEPVPDVVDPQARHRRRWGIASVSVGAAAVVSGIVLVALHGRSNALQCSGANVDPDGDCKFLYATRVPGIVVGVAGVGLVAAGAVLLVRGRRGRNERAQLTLGGLRF